MNTKIILILFCVFYSLTACAEDKVLNIQHWQTSNGATVYFVAAPQVPMVDIRLAFDAGSSRDQTAPGLAALTNRLLNQGAHQLNATQLAEQFENVGAQYANNVNRDQAVLSLRSLTAQPNLTTALQTFAMVVNHPDFSQAAFAQKKAEQLLNLQSRLESSASVASDAIYSTIYPDQPYHTPVLGMTDSLGQITQQQVNDFYHQFYVGKNATMAIVGAVTLEQAKAIAEQLTKDMPAGQQPAAIPLAPQLHNAISKHVDFPASQTVICLAQIGITYNNPDYFPLLVGNYVLGSGTMISRLSDAVREKRGLSYYIYSSFNPLIARGPFVIALATRKEQATQALAITKATLQQFLQQGADANELQAAKQYLTGSFPLHLASNADIADILITMGFYHLPLDYLDNYVKRINAVTNEQVKNAFTHAVLPQYLATITVGKVVPSSRVGQG